VIRATDPVLALFTGSVQSLTRSLSPADRFAVQRSPATRKRPLFSRRKRALRDEQMTQAACNCYASEISSADQRSDPAPAAPVAVSDKDSPIRVACVNNQCTAAPGVGCANGFCAFQILDRQRLTDPTVDFLKEQASDKISESALKAAGLDKDELIKSALMKGIQAFGLEESEILATLGGRVAVGAAVNSLGAGLGLLQSTSISLYRDG
jgi:hypothetical protein